MSKACPTCGRSLAIKWWQLLPTPRHHTPHVFRCDSCGAEWVADRRYSLAMQLTMVATVSVLGASGAAYLRPECRTAVIVFGTGAAVAVGVAVGRHTFSFEPRSR